MNLRSYTQCQSCGMPLKKDLEGGGSEKDGTKSKMYCSLCYTHGEFKDPSMTMKDMQYKVESVLRDEMKAPKIFIWLAKSQIPSLVRWEETSKSNPNMLRGIWLLGTIVWVGALLKIEDFSFIPCEWFADDLGYESTLCSVYDIMDNWGNYDIHLNAISYVVGALVILGGPLMGLGMILKKRD